MWNAAGIVLVRLSELTTFASRTETKLNHLHCKACRRHPRGAHPAKTMQGCGTHSVDTVMRKQIRVGPPSIRLKLPRSSLKLLIYPYDPFWEPLLRLLDLHGHVLHAVP